MKKQLLYWCLILPSLAFGQVTGYEFREINGYEVYIQESALNTYSQRTNEAIALLTAKLAEINDFGLQAHILIALQEVKIFVDWNTTPGAAVYHPNLQWLRQNGYIDEKYRSVEISNINNFINWSNQNQPLMVMHELAHAYHDQELGFGYGPILNAYNRAMADGQYDSVSYHSGNGNYFNQEAYATTNHIEYFAELTEAYLGENDFFPFFRTEIAAHDALGYEVVMDVWQFEVTSQQEVLSSATDRAFPNPVRGLLTVDIQQREAPTVIKIISTDGRLVQQYAARSLGLNHLDVSPLTAGLYVLQIGSQHYPIVKL
jgi:hypothetical protein